MSPIVFPSPVPGASSSSLLVTEASTAPAVRSQTSLTCQAACTGTIRWFGGQSTSGSIVSVSVGGVVSRTTSDVAQVATLPEASVAVKVT